MKLSVRIFLVSVLVAVSLASCGGEKTPPHLGVFIAKGKNYVEVPKSLGGPDASGQLVLSPESQPQIVVWDPEVNLDLFNLVQMKPDNAQGGFSPSSAIPYDVAPSKEGFLTLRPADPLPSSVYCLIQGDYLTTPDMIKHWCFEVAGKDGKRASTTTNQSSQSQSAPQSSTPVEIVAKHLVSCIDQEGQPVSDNVLAVWEVKVNDASRWVSMGIGEITVTAPDGSTIDTPSTAYGLASNQIGWVVPSGYSVRGNGSRIGDVDLGLGTIQWQPANGSAQYDGKVQFKLTTHSTSIPDYEALKDHPIHEITVDIQNGSDLRMARAGLFAVVLDSNGTPVSLLKEGLSAFVDYGQNATLQAKSISGWNCLGLKDPNDTYEIRYWIDFKTPSDETLTYRGVAHTKASQIVDDVGSFTSE